MDQLLLALISLGMMTVGAALFLISLVYGWGKDQKWMIFMSFALIALFIVSLFIGMVGEDLSSRLRNDLAIAEFVFLILAGIFFRQFMIQRYKR